MKPRNALSIVLHRQEMQNRLTDTVHHVQQSWLLTQQRCCFSEVPRIHNVSKHIPRGVSLIHFPTPNDSVEPRRTGREVKSQSFLASARTHCWATSSLSADTFHAARTAQIE